MESPWSFNEEITGEGRAMRVGDGEENGKGRAMRIGDGGGRKTKSRKPSTRRTARELSLSLYLYVIKPLY